MNYFIYTSHHTCTLDTLVKECKGVQKELHVVKERKFLKYSCMSIVGGDNCDKPTVMFKNETRF